ncbi:MAG: holo-ACP synthase [Oscillospiraceae bacterium]
MQIAKEDFLKWSIMIKTGIDLIEVKRIEKSLLKPQFMQRVYSLEEQSIINSKKKPAQTAAGHFCAKEAFSKAIGTGVSNFALKEVELRRDAMNAPYFYFTGKALEIVEKSGYVFTVSITHTSTYASAVVIAYTQHKTV